MPGANFEVMPCSVCGTIHALCMRCPPHVALCVPLKVPNRPQSTCKSLGASPQECQRRNQLPLCEGAPGPPPRAPLSSNKCHRSIVPASAASGTVTVPNNWGAHGRLGRIADASCKHTWPLRRAHGRKERIVTPTPNATTTTSALRTQPKPAASRDQHESMPCNLSGTTLT